MIILFEQLFQLFQRNPSFHVYHSHFRFLAAAGGYCCIPVEQIPETFISCRETIEAIVEPFSYRSHLLVDGRCGILSDECFDFFRQCRSIGHRQAAEKRQMVLFSSLPLIRTSTARLSCLKRPPNRDSTCIPFCAHRGSAISKVIHIIIHRLII